MPRIRSPTVDEPSIWVTCHTMPSSTTSLSQPEVAPPYAPAADAPAAAYAAAAVAACALVAGVAGAACSPRAEARATPIPPLLLAQAAADRSPTPSDSLRVESLQDGESRPLLCPMPRATNPWARRADTVAVETCPADGVAGTADVKGGSRLAGAAGGRAAEAAGAAAALLSAAENGRRSTCSDLSAPAAL